MEINTANSNNTVFALRYTYQERDSYITGTWGLYWSLPRARKALRDTMAALQRNDYKCTIDSPTTELVCMYRMTDNREYHLYIEKMEIE